MLSLHAGTVVVRIQCIVVEGDFLLGTVSLRACMEILRFFLSLAVQEEQINRRDGREQQESGDGVEDIGLGMNDRRNFLIRLCVRLRICFYVSAGILLR